MKMRPLRLPFIFQRENMTALTVDPFTYFCGQAQRAYSKICTAPQPSWDVLTKEFSRINATVLVSIFRFIFFNLKRNYKLGSNLYFSARLHLMIRIT